MKFKYVVSIIPEDSVVVFRESIIYYDFSDQYVNMRNRKTFILSELIQCSGICKKCLIDKFSSSEVIQILFS